MSEAKEYHISTVTDFLAVPQERRKVALAEFGEWLLLWDAIKPLVDAGAVAASEAFIWVDDDLGEARIGVKDGNGKVLAKVTVPMEPQP